MHGVREEPINTVVLPAGRLGRKRYKFKKQIAFKSLYSKQTKLGAIKSIKRMVSSIP